MILIPQSDLCNFEEFKFEYLRQESERANYRSWWYDLPEIRRSARSGELKIDPSRLYEDFEAWLNDASITYLRDMTTGERVRKLAPKRGNRAYSAKYRKKWSELEVAFDSCQFDEDFGGRGNMKRCRALLVTFTYDHNRTDLQTAWANVSKDLAQWRVEAKRKLGITRIASLTVKEGTESGYPAPHMIFILSEPVIAVKHHSKKTDAVTWRLHSFALLDAIKDVWRHGFADVQAIVNHSVSRSGKKKSAMSYVMKYLTKSIDLEGQREDDLSVKYKTIGVKTFAWQKLFLHRPLYLSKSFKEAVRLDADMPKPQHGFWVYDHSDHCKLNNVGFILSSKMPPDPHPWILPGQNTAADRKTTLQQIADMRAFIASGGVLSIESETYYLRFGKYPTVNH